VARRRQRRSGTAEGWKWTGERKWLGFAHLLKARRISLFGDDKGAVSQCARFLGLGYSTYASYEYGHSLPSVEKRDAMGAFMGWDREYSREYFLSDAPRTTPEQLEAFHTAQKLRKKMRKTKILRKEETRGTPPATQDEEGRGGVVLPVSQLREGEDQEQVQTGGEHQDR
jgi:transcriptional regulator with XRE-family HTH domain